jgi:hypothetical protein
MEVNGQPYAPFDLLAAPIEQEAEWAPDEE